MRAGRLPATLATSMRRRFSPPVCFSRTSATRPWPSGTRLANPAVDLVNVTGLARTRHDIVASAIGLQHGQLLTVADLAKARRRLAEVPSVMTSRISFTPGDDGRVQVDAAIVERPLMPTGTLLLAATGAHALTDRELSWSVASPSGGGELVGVAWRWWENRPRLGFRFSAPSPSHRLGGVWTIDAFAERQTYGGAEVLIEDRRGVALKAADWITGGLRWEAAVGFDDWRTRGRSVSVSGAVEQHLAADRLVVGLRGSLLTQDVDAQTAGARVRWRSAASSSRAGLDRGERHRRRDPIVTARALVWSGHRAGPRCSAAGASAARRRGHRRRGVRAPIDARQRRVASLEAVGWQAGQDCPGPVHRCRAGAPTRAWIARPFRGRRRRWCPDRRSWWKRAADRSRAGPARRCDRLLDRMDAVSGPRQSSRHSSRDS